MILCVMCHRTMVWVGKDLKVHLVPMLLLWAGKPCVRRKGSNWGTGIEMWENWGLVPALLGMLSLFISFFHPSNSDEKSHQCMWGAESTWLSCVRLNTETVGVEAWYLHMWCISLMKEQTHTVLLNHCGLQIYLNETSRSLLSCSS